MDRSGTTFEELIEGWAGVGVVTRYDRPTGSWIFVALHDATLGRPTGGTRLRVYDTPRSGLRDAMRLAEAMTRKWAVVGLDFGGGKAVLAVPRPLEDEARRQLLERYGRLLETLGGAFSTGEDLGTTPGDMGWLARTTRWVQAAHPVTGERLDPGPATALGVLSGMGAALEARLGSPELAGRSFLVQGLGDVGAPLARAIAAAGGRVLPCDVDGERAAALAEEIGATPVAPAEILETPCDVYAPCAVGGVVNRATIPRLRCRIVAGSANNQLERPEDAEGLRERGILYAPDFVLNAGGAIRLALLSRGVVDEEEIRGRVTGIRVTLQAIFEEAAGWGESPLRAADRRVERALARGRENEDARAGA